MHDVRVTLAVLLAAAIVGVPARYAALRHYAFRNFRVADEEKLYRSGHLKPEAMARVLHDHKIAAAVSFRAPDANDSDSWEEDFCHKNGVRHFRVKPEVWASDDGHPAPAQRAVDEFLAIVTNPANQPVLIHCLRGGHRTGAFSAVYRMECQHWTNAEAVAEMRELGYTTLDADVSVAAFLANYTPTWETGGK